MEQIKRRRSSFNSQNPFVGTFTRSKSQIYLHCLRSGRARSDSFRRCQFPADLRSKSSRLLSNEKSKKKSVTAESLDSTEMDDWSRVLIKDLRTRRVFSLSAEAKESGFCVGSEEGNESEKKKEAIEDGSCSAKNNTESTDSGPVIDQKDIGAKCLDTREVEIKEVNVEFRSQETSSIDLQVAERNERRCVDCEISGEERLQATPPDIEILQKLPVASDNLVPKSVLSSRSRAKVFKAPYSFSYRRLLPYLMAMEQDNTSTSIKGKYSNLDNQTVTKVAVKVDGKFMDDSAGGSGSHHAQSVDSKIRTPRQNDSSTMVSSPTSLDDELCTKRFIDNSNENIETSVLSICKNLETSIPDCSSKLDYPCINGEWELLDCEEAVEKHHSWEDEVRQGACSMVQAIVANHISSLAGREEQNGTMEEGSDTIAAKINDSNVESNPVNLSKGDESVSQSADQVLEGPVDGSASGTNSFCTDKRINSGSKRKLDLSPLSKLKLYKRGNSLNYRRMLPHLMDIAKDNSGNFTLGYTAKHQQSVEENLVPPLSMSVSHDKSIHLGTNNDFIQARGNEAGCTQSSLTDFDHNKDIKSVVMEKEQEPRATNHESGDNIQIVADGSNQEIMAMSSSDASNDCKKTTMAVTIKSASHVEEDSPGLSQKSNQLEAFGASEIASSGSRKGILKRSPRGCRGPCTCLNCASFRLNAERAFEFSKNQMQDAEEVALELIAELSHLQNMLSRAASASADNVVIPINQVKEACMRVSEAQEMAKNRLSDMNYDLNIHCRTTDGQRPRVKFSSNVEQRMISNANPSKDSDL